MHPRARRAALTMATTAGLLCCVIGPLLPSLRANWTAQAPEASDSTTTITGPGGRGLPPRSSRFTLALAGDSIITRPLSAYREPSFLKLVDLIKSADAAFTNLEMLFHDFEFPPMHESGGTWMRGDPALARELSWAGFRLVSRANNHAGDYGVGAMRLTTKYVAEAGLVQAGVGESLDEAREARFLDTPQGRVALISAASTFPDHARAARARASVPARPGLSPLRFATTYQLTPNRLETLRGLARDLGLRVSTDDREVRFLNARFIAADRPGVHTEPLASDLDEIAASVRNASRLADRTLVSIHAHEGLPGDRTAPAAFLVAFAHAMIDAGADVVAGHGPHIVRGIEMYKGKPILYSLGNFLFENDLVSRLPAEAYERANLGPLAGVADFDDARSDHDQRSYPADREIWEAIVATIRWQGRTLDDLTLTPISLGYGRSRLDRGRPQLADPDRARNIISDVAARSRAFGTGVSFENGAGHVNLEKSPERKTHP